MHRAPVVHLWGPNPQNQPTWVAGQAAALVTQAHKVARGGGRFGHGQGSLSARVREVPSNRPSGRGRKELSRGWQERQGRETNGPGALADVSGPWSLGDG